MSAPKRPTDEEMFAMLNPQVLPFVPTKLHGFVLTALRTAFDTGVRAQVDYDAAREKELVERRAKRVEKLDVDNRAKLAKLIDKGSPSESEEG